VGEGHFVASLRRQDSADAKDAGKFKPGHLADSHLAAATEKLFLEFCDEYLVRPLPGRLLQAGQDLYLVPPNAPTLHGLRVVRWGWWVGTIKGQVFAPGHALAMALETVTVRQSLNLTADDPRVAAYLRGESLQADGDPGWVLVAVDGLPLGWGKRTGDRVKNRRPSGLAQATRLVSELED
jgi:NOL1/NOP2/fmu family ribosome biogenesis protein